MRQMRILSVAVVSVCVLGIAMVANVSAQQFHASTTGKLLGKQLGNQVFETGAGTVTCTTAASTGTATALLVLTQLIETKYSNCTAFGFAEVKINTAKYLFSADNGQVTLDNTILIEVPLGGCSVSVPPQALKQVVYDNSNKKIIELSKVTGIQSTGSGGLCGGTNTVGTYTGNNQLELDGGTVSWS